MNTFGKFSDDNEGCGPRPPVPGKESRRSKMTEGHMEHFRESPPSYLKWARTLASLLEDREGVELFKKYVESMGGIQADRLNFYFACEGLKQQSDPEKVKLMIGAIYRFLRKSQMTIPEDIKRAIKAKCYLSPDIYDGMQSDVERIINETTYPNFLRSDIYVQHVQNMQAGLTGAFGSSMGTSYNNPTMAAGCSSSGGGGSGGGGGGGGVGVGSTGSNPTSTSSSSGSCSAPEFLKTTTLPTLHEDRELEFDSMTGLNLGGSHTPVDMPVKLTRDLLLATQDRRLEVRPPGAHGYSVYTASAYASYNPVSLQDSERQSLSSGRTDSDTMSIGSNSIDGGPYIRRQGLMEGRIMRQALTNKETEKFGIIPRTLRNECKKPITPDELYNQIYPKLERLRRQQETTDLLDRRLQENDLLVSDRLSNVPPSMMMSAAATMLGNQSNQPPHGAKTSKNLADAIREKFLPEDDNDQAILDQHVSRVWSDLTPSRSPGTMSPCPVNVMKKQRSTMTHDMHEMKYVIDGSSGLGSSMTMKHSRSMPEHSSSSKKLLSNKWPSMNTDSGISLFSQDLLLKSSNKDQSREFRDSRSRAGDSVISFQLEEAKRRLEDENRKSKRYPQSYSQPGSSTSTLPKAINDFTTVIFNFCDEEFPYRIKIPGLQPTLKQFKDFLPKKGNFRYFFKTVCDDIENPVIQEEIVSDFDLLPFYEGKVMGVVKPAE